MGAVLHHRLGQKLFELQPDPVDLLSRLARALRPGGLVIFQEHDSATVLGVHASLPLQRACAGMDLGDGQARRGRYSYGPRSGDGAHAGRVRVEGLRAEAIVQTAMTHYPAASIVRAMLPRIVGQGVATEQEIDIDPLDQRMVDERVKADTTFVGELAFGAWARKLD